MQTQLTLTLGEKTIRKIQALSKLKGVDADYIGELLSDNIDEIITSAIADELGISVGDSGMGIMSASRSEKHSNDFSEDLNEEDNWDDDNSEGEETTFMPSHSHELSSEDEGVEDTTPNPLVEIEQDLAASAPGGEQKKSSSFSSLIDENINQASITDDPEEYMEEMIDTTQAVDATLMRSGKSQRAEASTLLSEDRDEITPASRTFRGPRVKISEHTVNA